MILDHLAPTTIEREPIIADVRSLDMDKQCGYLGVDCRNLTTGNLDFCAEHLAQEKTGLVMECEYCQVAEPEPEPECLYCYNLVTTWKPNPPNVEDSEMWDVLAGEHDPDCEWILTKAHREF